MEQTSDTRMAWLVGQFTAFGIVPETSREGFVQVRRAMERRTGSWVAEAVILVGAYLLAYGGSPAMPRESTAAPGPPSRRAARWS